MSNRSPSFALSRNRALRAIDRCAVHYKTVHCNALLPSTSAPSKHPREKKSDFFFTFPTQEAWKTWKTFMLIAVRVRETHL